MEKEEIIMIGEYKSFRSDRHYSVGSASNEEIAALLVQLSEFIEPYVYQFSGIDTKKIDSMIKVEKGMAGVIAFLKSFKRDMLLPAAQNKSTMLPIAESYLLNQVFKQAGIAFKPSASTSLQSETEKPESQVAFIGNCKGWFAAKKLGINEKTQDWEVAGILSGINYTLVNKAFDFAGSKSDAKSGRKSIGKLSEALSQINENDAYAVCKTCEGFNYFIYAAPQILVDAYPDIKPPKVKGRVAKG